MFQVNKESPENSLKFFIIDRKEDFIQKDVTVRNIEIETGTYGKQLKITVGRDEAESYNWVAQEPGPDKEINGKILTTKAQADSVMKVVTHIGRRFLGEDFTASGKNFEEFCNDLIKQTKPLWEKTKLNAKFIINDKGYGGLAKYVPFLENEGENKLKITTKDEEALIRKRTNATSVNKEADVENDEVSAAKSDDLPF